MSAKDLAHNMQDCLMPVDESACSNTDQHIEFRSKACNTVEFIISNYDFLFGVCLPFLSLSFLSSFLTDHHFLQQKKEYPVMVAPSPQSERRMKEFQKHLKRSSMRMISNMFVILLVLPFFLARH